MSCYNEPLYVKCLPRSRLLQENRLRMASQGTDVSELSESQQLALQQYTAVTDQDVAAAIPLLRRSEWNVQVR